MRFIGLLVAAAAVIGFTYLAAVNAPRNDDSSAYFAFFGLLAVAALWIISAVLAGNANPFSLAMGADNRLSTSKMQALLWTACVGFVYAMLYADRAITHHFVAAIDDIPRNVLIALGFSLTSVV